MSGSNTVHFRDDARWDGERDCVEVTAVVRESGREYRVPCAITREALETLVDTDAPLDPLRLFRDFEGRLESVVAGKARGRPPEIAVTRRDMKR
jgi:hypothetical protein